MKEKILARIAEDDGTDMDEMIADVFCMECYPAFGAFLKLISEMDEITVVDAVTALANGTSHLVSPFVDTLSREGREEAAARNIAEGFAGALQYHVRQILDARARGELDEKPVPDEDPNEEFRSWFKPGNA